MTTESTDGRMVKTEVEIVTSEEFNKRLSDNISKYRKMNGLSQKDLGECIGYSNKSVSKWERGDGVPDIFTAFVISETLGVSLSELVGQAEKSKSTLKKEKALEKDEKAREKARKKALSEAAKKKNTRK